MTSSAPLIPSNAPFGVVGRYAVFEEIASGGMATVHLGKLLGAGGFSRIVAIKRLHPQFAKDTEFANMFMDEARLAARIHHPNVVQTIDVVTVGKELLLVMEYVHGASFAALLGASRRSGRKVAPRIVSSVMVGALEGLHAAHEARSETGAPLGVVHRDVSPQNIMIGVEGVARILDFGVAKAIGKIHSTREGQLKGKLAYMSPEQVRGREVTRQSDVFSASIVLWEALTGERLFNGQNPGELILQVLDNPIHPPRAHVPDLPAALDKIVMRGLSRDVQGRYATARELATALEGALGVAPSREVAEWVESMAGESILARAKVLETIERSAVSDPANSMRFLESSILEHGPTERPPPLTIREPPGDGGVAFDSGPRPRLPLADPAIFDATMPQAAPPAALLAAEERMSSKSQPGGGEPLPSSQPRPLSSGARRGTDSGDMPASGKPISSHVSRSESASTPRPHGVPIPVRGTANDDQDDRSALRERLETPLKVVGVGVLISVLDWALREITSTLPVRPLWFAEALVVFGVAWAFARVFLLSRE